MSTHLHLSIGYDGATHEEDVTLADLLGIEGEHEDRLTVASDAEIDELIELAWVEWRSNPAVNGFEVEIAYARNAVRGDRSTSWSRVRGVDPGLRQASSRAIYAYRQLDWKPAKG